MKEDLKGLYLAVMLSVVIIFATNFLFPSQQKVAPESAVETTAEQKTEPTKVAPKIVENEKSKTISHKEALAESKRISFENDAIKGSIRLKGARIDELYLKKYKETLAENSPLVELLSPAKTEDAYYADFGWTTTDKNLILPTSETEWKVKEGNLLTTQTPIILEWNNGQGITFSQKISLDENYMFIVEQKVLNNSAQEISLYPYGLVHHDISKNDASSSVVHNGAIGVINNVLKEIKYADLEDAEKFKAKKGGWAGFTDRYWFTAFILDNNSRNEVKMFETAPQKFQVDFLGKEVRIATNASQTNKVKLFSGAKEIKLLDSYQKKYDISKFDLAVDFGWYYFLTKPFFYILNFFYQLIGNMGWAILLFAALLRLVMFPVANKSYESMSKMKKVQPKMQEIQQRYKEDKVRLQQETMNLYRKEKINPAAGCLPVLIQIPVFFSLYKVLNFSIELRQAPFIGWIKDLSAPDPLTISTMLHMPIPNIINIGLWPIFMGLTMYIQQKLNPAPTNKDQARVFAMMPLIFTFMLGHFASGLVIYWTLSNILSIVQQRYIMKKNGV
ncbi:MAG: membrane protein insertase YidC [Alphaproteobacteria bacterium]|nr:membrane protein insertase YidC [Alphaproteobacteria bacterium]